MKSFTKYPRSMFLTVSEQRREVFEGRAEMTKGGLTKQDLKLNTKTGKIVSRRASEIAKRRYKENGLSVFQYTK